MLAAPPFIRNAGHFCLRHLTRRRHVIVQGNAQRLDARHLEHRRERGASPPSPSSGAFATLLDQLEARQYDLSSLMVLGSGGAVLSPHMKRALLAKLPSVMIVDGYGASETGIQGSTATMAGGEVPKAFRMDENTVLLDEELRRRLRHDESATGWVARSGRMPLGYLGDAEKTRRTYPTVEGVRYSVPGDRGQYAADGSITVFGRDSVCINTGGEKVFAEEEVETALKSHPAVYDVIVTGIPSERWGEQVTAVVALRPGATASEEELRETAAVTLARYKLPRAVVFVDEVVRAPSGKPDYRWARAAALAQLGARARGQGKGTGAGGLSFTGPHPRLPRSFAAVASR